MCVEQQSVGLQVFGPQTTVGCLFTNSMENNACSFFSIMVSNSLYWAVLVSSVLRALWHWLWPCGQSLARCCLLARCPQHADQLLVLCGEYFRSIRPFTCYMCHVTSYSFFHANDDNNSRPLDPEYSKPGLDTCSFLLRMTGEVLLTE